MINHACLFKFLVLVGVVKASFLQAFALNQVIGTIAVEKNPTGMAATNEFVYVTNSTSNTVSVIRIADQAVIDTISGFTAPYAIALNQAGTLAYVANSTTTTVSVIDLSTNKIIHTLSGFDGPSGFAITPDGKTAYVNNYGCAAGSGDGKGTTVSVVDLTSNTIVKTIKVGLAPSSVAVRPDGCFAYVLSYVDGKKGNGLVNVIDTKSNEVSKTVSGFFGPYTIAITPDGKEAYITNFGNNDFKEVGESVDIFDLTSDTIVKSIKLGLQPSGIAITFDGKHAYVTNYYDANNPNFGLYSSDSEVVAPQIGAFSGEMRGQAPRMRPKRTQDASKRPEDEGVKSEVRVNNSAKEGTVSVINTGDHSVNPQAIAVGKGPGAITLTPDNRFAYVSNYISNTVSVIKIRQ